ncbi:MAG: hypothetical protein QNK20_10030 [Aureibaculum sp.]|nr:hypothetical protein [Aureibaculum sp.]
MIRHLNYIPLLLMVAFVLLSGCRKKKEVENKLVEKEKDYKYEKAILQYDLGDSIRQDIEVYISQNNDTTAFQKITYENNKIDSTRSRFYKLNLYRDKKTNLFGGKLNYFFDSINDGKVEHFIFAAIKKHNEKVDRVEFENYDLKSNSLEFSFEHDTDTLMGFVHVIHAKDTIEDEGEKIRLREIIFAIDNYNRTNNPFVEIKL